MNNHERKQTLREFLLLSENKEKNIVTLPPMFIWNTVDTLIELYTIDASCTETKCSTWGKFCKHILDLCLQNDYVSINLKIGKQGRNYLEIDVSNVEPS